MVSELIGIRGVSGDSLLVTDLLTDLSQLSDELVDQLTGGDALDAFLLCAGLVQIADDFLQRDPLLLRRAAGYWRDARIPELIIRPLDLIASATESAMMVRRKDVRAAKWRADAAALCDELAAHALAVGPAPWRWEALAAAKTLRDEAATLDNSLRHTVLRIPSCFRSFDQQPEDMARLAERFAAKHRDRDRPLLVLGVRTSGSYLAPLVAAALRADGYSIVSSATARPGRRIPLPAKELLRGVRDGGGRVCIVDDPPETGGAIGDVAARVHGHGVPNDSITLLLPLFGTRAPEALRAYDQVLLPFQDWAIHQRLTADTVATVLPTPVRSIRDVRRGAPGNIRGHLRALFDIDLVDGERRRIAAAGAGVGYFGRHAIAVARALPHDVPKTYGFRDGVLLREWLPEENLVGTPSTGDVDDLVSYIRNRAESLPARGDASARLSGRQPVWEAASRVIERGYGRLGVGLRPAMIGPLVKSLLAVERPSVVDGATELTNWFRGGRSLTKIDADVRAFANTDLSCYDPVYDLAGIYPGGRDAGFVGALRDAMPCDDERFLLYELVHLWDRERAGHAAHRESSRAAQRYVAAQLLTGIRCTPTGPLCALDVDGMLESDALGFSIMTPTATWALRALFSHGYQPIPVTGRSLDEVIERCEAYGMLGGVAEYGAVAYRHANGEVRELVTEADTSALDRLRDVLRATPDVEVDEDYRRIVRARRTHGGPLSAAAARAAISENSVALQVIHGDSQTDFVPKSVTKANGLACLTELLGGHRDIALAVGDAAPDIPMFAMARTAFAPGNADDAVRAANVTVVRGQYAAGFFEATQRFLGHAPGACPVCRAPEPSPRTRTLLTLLDAQRAGRRGLPGAVVRGMSRLPRKTS